MLQLLLMEEHSVSLGEHEPAEKHSSAALSCSYRAVPDTTDSSCLVPRSSLQAKAGLYTPGEAAHCYVFFPLPGTDLALEEFPQSLDSLCRLLPAHLEETGSSEA